MDNILTVENIIKKYGSKTALDGVSFSIAPGRALGLIGPNGSGKTTIIKLLAGYLKPNSGNISVCGKKIGTETKAMISYLPDRNFIPKDFRIYEALKIYDDFFYDFDASKCSAILKSMDLDEKLTVSDLSKGMTEKLHIALIMSRHAKLYVLDEPIAGVDPIARDQIMEAVVNNLHEDSAMLITTHLVRDMEQMFDDVAFIMNGKIVLYGDAENIRSENAMSIDEMYKNVFGGVHYDR